MSSILNLGCGTTLIAGAVNVDLSADVRADIVHDLSIVPWPFPDNSFSEVHAQDIIEHLPDTLSVFEEIHRVSRNGARVHVTVPHFSSANAFADPTHKRFFTYRTFDFLTQNSEQPHYMKTEFKICRRVIVFERSDLLSRLAWRFANRHPYAYEMRFAWIFPALLLSVELEVIKQPT